MRLNVAEIKDDPGAHKTVLVEVGLESMADEVRFPGVFAGEAEAWNTGDSILVKGRLTGEAIVTCSRCLTDVKLTLTVDFSEEFMEGARRRDDEPDADEDGREFSPFQGDEIDLSEPLRQTILLELPMKPLCSDACKGICPDCGTNLNEGECRCSAPTSVDPRLSALKQLLDKPDS